MDFEHSEVIDQSDITLDTSSHVEDIPMEFEHVKDKPILMDTEGEEVVGRYSFFLPKY